jgi:hypothetical protein
MNRPSWVISFPHQKHNLLHKYLGGIDDKAIDEFKGRGTSAEHPALSDRVFVDHGKSA